MSKRQILPRKVMAGMIKGYQRFISPCFPSCCRYEPTCSAYALEAVTRYGCLRGGWLAFKRVLRCHPFSPGGYDPLCSEKSLEKTTL